MSDLFLSSQQQLGAALQQLGKLAPNSPLVKQASEIIVRHLGGNQLALSSANQAKPLKISATELQGKLISGQSYQTRISVEAQNTLLQFLAKQPAAELVATLSPKQSQTLFNLPVLQTQLANTGSKPLVVAATVVATTAAQISLKFTAQQTIQQLSLPQPNATTQFSPGQQVLVQLTPQANGWQARLISPPAGGVAPSTAESFASVPGTTTGPSAVIKINEGQLQSILKAAGIVLNQTTANLSAPTQANIATNTAQQQLFQSPLVDREGDTSQVAQVSVKALVAKLQANTASQNTQLLASLLALKTDKLEVILKPDGRINLLNNQPGVVAQLPVSNNLVKELQALRLPLDAQLSSDIKNSASPATTEASQSPSDSKTGNVNSATANINKTAPPALAVEHKNQLQQLLRQVFAIADSPSQAISRIEAAISDPLLSRETALKPLFEQLVQQVKQALPQGKEQDAAQIKQLISTPPLSLSSAQIASAPAPSQGLLGGLITLLQVSLSSRLLRNQPAQLERISQALEPLISGGGAKSPPSMAQSGRALLDFFQVEQKHQMLKEIGRLLASHQSNKLASAEQVSQGQDTLFYTLPIGSGETRKDIELLIRRQTESNNKASKDPDKNKQWHLTMKLSVGEIGELLTKAKLQQNNLEVDFYASNEQTRDLVLNFLPLLKKRLAGLGIDVNKSKCQLGKIPVTLQQRPYQIFETQA